MIGGELTSSGIRDEIVDGAVEIGAGQEILKGDVHSPAPVVAGNGRDVDPLILRLALVTDLTDQWTSSPEQGGHTIEGEFRCWFTIRSQIHGSQKYGAVPSQ